MTCSVRILWGSCPEPGDTAITYEFQAEAELVAFLYGVETACGWLDHTILEPNETYCFDCHSPFEGESCPSCVDEDEEA